jgi:peptidoglycan-associated lipoprotein
MRAFFFLLIVVLLAASSCRHLPGVDKNAEVRKIPENQRRMVPAPSVIADTSFEEEESPISHGDHELEVAGNDLPQTDSPFIISTESINDDFESMPGPGSVNKMPSATALAQQRRMFGPIYFAYNQSMIGDEGQGHLKRLAGYLEKYPQFYVAIEGHCDERGSSEYNRGLGERRAIAVRSYLSKLNVKSARMNTVSYGEEKPAVPGTGESVYIKNRRAELFVYQPQSTP